MPAAKRQWGYYVLPILHRERIVARADAAIDARAGLLRVHALYREPGVRRTPALDRALARALERLAAWRGARARRGRRARPERALLWRHAYT